MEVTLEKLLVDIQRLHDNKKTRVVNIRTLRDGIKKLKRERAELEAMGPDSGYDPEAMRKNIERLGWQMQQIEAVIQKEYAANAQIDGMIEVLQKKRARMETAAKAAEAGQQ